MRLQLNMKANAEYYGLAIGGIIEIDIEEYVKGVVAAEIGGASVEACKAQAIASRTAAYPYYSKDKVVSDESSKLQCFSALRLRYVKESFPEVYEAVEATRGMLLYYDRKVITTCSYCDSNGGRTVSSKERWGGDRPWLIAQDDPWDYAVSKGKKNGHGVGMSQTGLKYAVSSGKDYRSILAFYYPGTTIGKEGETMGMTVSIDAFVEGAKKIKDTYTVKYKDGSSGEKDGSLRLCDCRGYIIWILRTLGIDITSTGTNWMIRNQMTEVHKVTSASQLQRGQVVFKSRTDISKMPSRYKKGKADYNAHIGEIDVYHVGVVISTSPKLVIYHCSSGGIRVDDKLGQWNWAGEIEWISQSASGIENTVVQKEEKTDNPTGTMGVVIGCGKLNLRKAPSKSAPRIEYILPDDSVTILKTEVGVTGWYYVKYKTWTGYVMSDYVRIFKG